jgi:hypothetical protein
MEVVKNGFVDFAPTVSVRRRAHSADPLSSEMVPFESADLFRETPQGEPICPSHPFCIPCMNTEGRYCGRQSKRSGTRRAPAICRYRQCRYCHHSDHWGHRQKTGERWSDLVHRRLAARHAARTLNPWPERASKERFCDAFSSCGSTTATSDGA